MLSRLDGLNGGVEKFRASQMTGEIVGRRYQDGDLATREIVLPTVNHAQRMSLMSDTSLLKVFVIYNHTFV